MSVACLVSATAAFAADEGGGTRKIGEGNHSMFVVGDDSVAVFETFHSGHAGKLLEAVRSVTDKPVKFPSSATIIGIMPAAVRSSATRARNR
jgi:hypothetical protein